jgi:predicted short-subunit dehydrogenase-like oxidoreductase (DUF2520 family)
MPSGNIQRVVLIGAGNVAWHLGHALSASGIRILQVISRSLSSCRELAGKTEAMATNDIRMLDREADAYILAIPDDVLPSVLSQAVFGTGILLHTAGSVSLEVLKPHADHFGVLYPLQTFTKGRKLEFSTIPLLIEASDPDALNSLKALANKLSYHVSEADSATRCMLHVAAVFACNFSNHMFAAAEKLLKQHNQSLKLLEPLMRETLLKALEITPGKAQTGPALRGDRKVIMKHLEQLHQHPELQEMYRVISNSILKQG